MVFSVSYRLITIEFLLIYKTKKLKTLKQILFILVMLSVSQTGFSQMNPIKKFDYSLLNGKTLLIPTLAASDSYLKKMAKKGKLEGIKDTKKAAEYYNTIWKEAMAESSYDATDYDVRAFDVKKLIKEKNEKTILLYYKTDKNGNMSAALTVTGPKRQVVAETIINGLNLFSKNDLRLMMNMLNESLLMASELEQKGDKSIKAIKGKYKQGIVDFYDNIGEKTLLVPKSEHKKTKESS